MHTCLVVEDSAVIRVIMSEMLRELGFEAVECSTAPEAVDCCLSKTPKLVLLDWDLPNFGALDFLRGVGTMAAEERPLIILCATENDHQQFSLAKAAGAAHHILKPFDKVLLAKMLVAIDLLGEDRLVDLEPEELAADIEFEQPTGTA